MQFDPQLIHLFATIKNKIACNVLIGFQLKLNDFLVKAKILEKSLCWHDILTYLLILSVYTKHILLRTKCFCFTKFKITNYWRAFKSATLRIWTLIGYCKCILIVNFVSRNVSYVAIYILWKFCFINHMNVTDIDLCDSFIEVEMFSQHYHDFLPLKDWAENRKKLSRWIDFSFNSLDESGYFLEAGTCNH